MEQQLESFAGRALFGGAIECALPTRFMDVSTVREVPDHQEVFADVKTDQSVIVELVNMAEASDDDAAAYHFRDLADDNDATHETTIISVESVNQADLPHFPPGTVCRALVGQQRIAKFNERTNAKNLVTIYLAVVRLPLHGTDILMTLNDPVYIAPGSSSSQGALAQQVLGREGLNSSTTVFRVLLRSLKVNDYSLFNGQDEEHQ